MDQGPSARVREIVRDMDSGDTARAVTESRTLAREVWAQKPSSFPPDGIASSFRSLLRRRGYYVSTPRELARSLEEIRSIGEGFDLYDLARALGEVDTIVVDCLALSSTPMLPEARPFSRCCPCGRHSGPLPGSP